MKPPKPSAGRVAAHRKRLREQGLRPLEIWAAPEHHPVIREFVAQLQESTDVQRQPEMAVRPAAQAGEGETEKVPG